MFREWKLTLSPSFPRTTWHYTYSMLEYQKQKVITDSVKHRRTMIGAAITVSTFHSAKHGSDVVASQAKGRRRNPPADLGWEPRPRSPSTIACSALQDDVQPERIAMFSSRNLARRSLACWRGTEGRDFIHEKILSGRHSMW